jgi:SAM-dependent methyltransferase
MRATAFADQYDDIIRAPRMRELYGDSGYFNVGYWDEEDVDLPRACDRMVDEVARAVPEGARNILDAGCGVGAGTARLARHFPEARVIGGNLSPWQLKEARGRGVRSVVLMDAARLPFASGTLDAVLAIESPQHFATREQFFREALRVLRPGGSISVADMLFSEREAIGAWMLPAENVVPTPGDYADRLSATGFEAVAVRDVTHLTWQPFCEAMRPVFRGAEAQLRAYAEALSAYVLASARKP